MQSTFPTASADPLTPVHPTLRVPHRSANSIFKRLLDIVGSLVGLLILALLFMPLSIAIKLDSPGPVFYAQQRYGLLGKPFRIYKFPFNGTERG